MERGNLESSTIRNVSKVLKWVNEISIYRPRSSGHLASSKRSSGGFFIKKSGKYAISHELQQFRTIVRSGKSINTIFVFLKRFAWLCEINFHFSHGVLQPKSILFQFARLCEFFACSCEIEKHGFSTPFCNFSHFFILIPLQPPPNQLQIPIQFDCIASFIMHLDHHQLYLFSSIWFISFVTNLSKTYLKMTPKLHKTCL